MAEAPLVEMRGIRKSFGPAEVLRGVDFDLRRGQIHALAGANGAGKSTLIKILGGVHRASGGEVRLAGAPVAFADPQAALRAGVVTIHQEGALVGSMSVEDNLALGRERWWVDRRAQRASASRLLARVGLEVDPRARVGSLPVATRQLVEVARALALDCRVLVLDEPTSALGAAEAEVLHARVKALAAGGVGVIWISHRLEEIYALAGWITVLRDGEVVGSASSSVLGRALLVRLLVGGKVEEGVGERERVGTPTSTLLSANISVSGRPPAALTLNLHPGEILALAGFAGCGHRRVLRALFGALPSDGEVHLRGRPYRRRSPRASVARGLALLTDDRKGEGLLLERSVIENTSLASLRALSRAGWVQRRPERAAAAALAGRTGLVAPGLDAPARTLSGGNQQKVYLARWMMTRPAVWLMDEPTRGVDVGARADIHALIRAEAARGAGIVVICADLDEALALADRVIVMHRGRQSAALGAGATRAEVLAAAMGAT